LTTRFQGFQPLTFEPKSIFRGALLYYWNARLGAQYPQNKSQKKSQKTELFPAAPILTTSYATRYGELSFFSMFTTFGTPQNITLESLRVEHMFAADKTTHAVLREQVQ
jgi:hypothetical protein